MGEEARGGRPASPRKAARIEPLWASGTLARHVPSAPQTVSAMCAERRARHRELDLERRARGRGAVREAQGARELDRPRADAAARGAHRDARERPGVARRARAQVGELGVERLAGARGRVAVAVAADALERDRRAARIAVRRAAARGHHDLALGRDAVERELPADQARQRVHPRLGEQHGAERPDRRDTGRDGVVALRLGADHGLVDPARAALEHLAVLVDEEVVADVVPAVGVAVVARDPEHDPRRLLGPVVVRADRVVDERGLHLAVLGRRARRDGVAAPLGAGDDRGLGRLGGARPHALAASGARRRPVTWRAARAVGWARTKRARTAPAEPRSRSWKTSAAPV